MSDTSNLAIALETVAQLDRELTTAVEQADTLAAHTFAAHRRLIGLRSSLERSVTGTRGLREELLAFAGDASEHYQEVALRERTAAVETRLANLVLFEYDTGADASDLYVGKFNRLADVNKFLVEQISAVNGACLRARIGVESWRDDDPAMAVGRAQYRSALVTANKAFAALGSDPDLSHFLQAGAVVLSEPFRAACRAIATLLDVPFETEIKVVPDGK